MTNTKLILSTIIAVPLFCAAGFFAGTYTATGSANGYAAAVNAQYNDQRNQPQGSQVNPRALPALPAPKDRTDPELESFVARMCAYAARLGPDMYDDVRLRGATREDVARIIAQNAPEDKDAAKLNADIINHIANIIFSKDYDFTKTELASHAYQYCDLKAHKALMNGGEL